MSRAALYCEVNFPVNAQNGNDDAQIRNMKRIPLPESPKFDMQDFHTALHAAIPKGKKYVIDVMARRLSQHADFSDYYAKYPDDWDRMQELRGR